MILLWVIFGILLALCLVVSLINIYGWKRKDKRRLSDKPPDDEMKNLKKSVYMMKAADVLKDLSNR